MGMTYLIVDKRQTNVKDLGTKVGAFKTIRAPHQVYKLWIRKNQMFNNLIYATFDDIEGFDIYYDGLQNNKTSTSEMVRMSSRNLAATLMFGAVGYLTSKPKSKETTTGFQEVDLILTHEFARNNGIARVITFRNGGGFSEFIMKFVEDLQTRKYNIQRNTETVAVDVDYTVIDANNILIGADENYCPHCGIDITEITGNNCPSCGTVLNNSEEEEETNSTENYADLLMAFGIENTDDAIYDITDRKVELKLLKAKVLQQEMELVKKDGLSLKNKKKLITLETQIITILESLSK